MKAVIRYPFDRPPRVPLVNRPQVSDAVLRPLAIAEIAALAWTIDRQTISEIQHLAVVVSTLVMFLAVPMIWYGSIKSIGRPSDAYGHMAGNVIEMAKEPFDALLLGLMVVLPLGWWSINTESMNAARLFDAFLAMFAAAGLGHLYGAGILAAIVKVRSNMVREGFLGDRLQA